MGVRMRVTGLLLAAALTLAACGSASTVTQGFAEAAAVENDLQASSQCVKVFVSFKWRGGLDSPRSRCFSTQTLGNGQHRFREIEAATRTAIAKEFKQVPEAINVSFTFAP